MSDCADMYNVTDWGLCFSHIHVKNNKWIKQLKFFLNYFSDGVIFFKSFQYISCALINTCFCYYSIKDKSMHNYTRLLSLVIIVSMLTGCVKHPFFNEFVAPYQIGISYYQNGTYQIESIIQPESWETQKNNVWMGKLHTFHIQAALSDKTEVITYDQKGFYSEYDYFELQIHPDKRQSYRSELLIFVHGLHAKPGKLIFSQTYQGAVQFIQLTADNFKLAQSFVNKIRIGQEIVDAYGTRFPVLHLFVSPKQSSDFNAIQKSPQSLISDNEFSKQNQMVKEETLSPEPVVERDVPPYLLGIRSAFDHAHIAGAISQREWKANDHYYEARLFTFKISILSPDRRIKKIFKQKGFAYQSSYNIDSFVVDLNNAKKNTVPLIVRIYGFSKNPLSLKFSQKLKGASSFFELRKDSFIIDNRPAEKLEIAKKLSIQGINYPVVNLFYDKQDIEQQPPRFVGKNVVTTIIEDYDLIASTIKDAAYLEYINNDIIVATSPVNEKEISCTFESDKIPTNVHLRTRQKSIKTQKIGRHRFQLSLKPFIKKVIVKNHRNQCLSNTTVHIYLDRKKQVHLQTKASNSFFAALNHLFSKPKVSHISEKITLYSGKTNKNGIAAFVDLGYPLHNMRVDITKPGYQIKENIPVTFPLQIRLEPRTKMLETMSLHYGICENESARIHQTGGQLEIYDNGQLCASLSPEDHMILPFVKNPVYRFKHPDYYYQDIIIDTPNRQMKIVPKSRIQHPQGQMQVLIIMDVTDDDPRGVAFLKTTEALLRYLAEIQWDALPAEKKHRIKVASAYQDHLNYFDQTGDIDNNILMIQADCSLTDQLKKAFAQFDSHLQGKKKVIYIISSRRASVVVDDHLVNRINTDRLIQNQTMFSGIVVGKYGGKGLKKLSTLTSGHFSYCKTSDDIYYRLNDVVGSLTNESQVISCSNHP